MKYFLSTLLFSSFIVLLFSCGSDHPSRLFETPQDMRLQGINGLDEALALISEDHLKRSLYFLASDELRGRESGDRGNEMAARYIAEDFQGSGLTSGLPSSYFQEFKVDIGNGRTSNVLGLIPGSDPSLKEELVVIGAHFDHIGMRPVIEPDTKDGNPDDPEEDLVYNGADDNASGTVAIMEVARAIGKIKPILNRTVLFIAFSGEEDGRLGSIHYLNSALWPLNKIVFMMNLDMVGRLKNGRLHFYGGRRHALMAKLLADVSAKYPEVQPNIALDTGGMSDHATFIEKKIPAIDLHTGKHDDFHEITDSAEKINYPGLTAITKIALELTWTIAQRKDLPGAQWTDVSLSHEDLELDHGILPFGF